MSGQSTRARRARLDPRAWQVVTIAAYRWFDAPPGPCAFCGSEDGLERTTALFYFPAPPAEALTSHDALEVAADAHCRELSAHQREGVFTLRLPPSPACYACAVALALSTVGATPEEGATSAEIDTMSKSVRLQAFLATQEPAGATSVAMLVAYRGPGEVRRCSLVLDMAQPFDPSRQHQRVRRRVDRGEYVVEGIREFVWEWLDESGRPS